MQRYAYLVCLVAAATVGSGCTRYRDDLQYDRAVEYRWREPDGVGEYALFAGVERDTRTWMAMRPYLVDQQVVSNRKTLVLFPGPGVLAVECAFEGAQSVLVAADSPLILDCVRYNIAANNQDDVVTAVLTTDAVLPVAHQNDQYDVILARLAAGDDSVVSRNVGWLLTGATRNLTAAGKMWVACETQDLATQFETACQAHSEVVVTRDPQSPGAPVLTITKKILIPAPPPAGQANPPRPDMESTKK